MREQLLYFTDNYVSTIRTVQGETAGKGKYGSHVSRGLILLTAATARRSGVSSLLPPNDDIPLSFSMNSISGSESIKSSIFTVSVSTFAALTNAHGWKIAGSRLTQPFGSTPTEVRTDRRRKMQFALAFN